MIKVLKDIASIEVAMYEKTVIASHSGTRRRKWKNLEQVNFLILLKFFYFMGELKD